MSIMKHTDPLSQTIASALTEHVPGKVWLSSAFSLPRTIVNILAEQSRLLSEAASILTAELEKLSPTENLPAFKPKRITKTVANILECTKGELASVFKIVGLVASSDISMTSVADLGEADCKRLVALFLSDAFQKEFKLYLKLRSKIIKQLNLLEKQRELVFNLANKPLINQLTSPATNTTQEKLVSIAHKLYSASYLFTTVNNLCNVFSFQVTALISQTHSLLHSVGVFHQ